MLHSRRVAALILGFVVLTLALVGVSAEWRQPSSPPGPMGPGVCVSYGQNAAQQLAELSVHWYMDWTFTTPDIPGYGRLYVVSPRADLNALARAAAARPGGWWTMGNEPNDANQDNQTPAEHAAHVDRVTKVIRRADPSAHIVSAGIANADWQWAEVFRQEYKQLTGAYPDFAAWNIHNYILDDDHDPYDVAEFKRRIASFRAWMAHIGDGDKPLLLSEFGVLYGAGCCDRPVDPPERGVAFMTEAATWLARGDLVQAWAWFMTHSGDTQFNGDLFDALDRLSSFGQAYRALNRAIERR